MYSIDDVYRVMDEHGGRGGAGWSGWNGRAGELRVNQSQDLLRQLVGFISLTASHARLINDPDGGMAVAARFRRLLQPRSIDRGEQKEHNSSEMVGHALWLYSISRACFHKPVYSVPKLKASIQKKKKSLDLI